jgi:pimeloyl-ACP methyl ester carboxylesterase
LTVEDTLDDENYDEFGLLHQNADELGIPYARPVIERIKVPVEPFGDLSMIKWGEGDPELVLLHGGGQNAHTWDYVLLGLGKPALAIDLPGHGRSYRRNDRNYGPWRNVDALEQVIPKVAPNAKAIGGMSLGGATTTHFAAKRPDLVRKAVIIDVTPQINDPSREMTTQERGTVALIGQEPTWQTFDELAQMAVALSPYRGPDGVKRGVRHNTIKGADGVWRWRYDLFGPRGADVPEGEAEAPPENWADFTPMWEEVGNIKVPAMFVRGGLSKFILDEDVAEMQRRLPSLRVETVDGAGHAVQSDQPAALIALLRDFVWGE